MRTGDFSRLYGHYSTWDEWGEGRQAYNDGKDLDEANPYEEDSEQWVAWRVGWYGIA